MYVLYYMYGNLYVYSTFTVLFTAGKYVQYNVLTTWHAPFDQECFQNHPAFITHNVSKDFPIEKKSYCPNFLGRRT